MTSTTPAHVAHLPTVHLNKAATCRQLKISERCLETMIAAGRFPPGVRLGREKFWSQATVDEFLQREFNIQAAFWRSHPH